MTKEERQERARKFCKEVKLLAKEYNLPFFLVTYGASITSNNNCEAVRVARKNHIEWEKEYGFNPNEDWSRKDER